MPGRTHQTPIVLVGLLTPRSGDSPLYRSRTALWPTYRDAKDVPAATSEEGSVECVGMGSGVGMEGDRYNKAPKRTTACWNWPRRPQICMVTRRSERLDGWSFDEWSLSK